MCAGFYYEMPKMSQLILSLGEELIGIASFTVCCQFQDMSKKRLWAKHSNTQPTVLSDNVSRCTKTPYLRSNTPIIQVSILLL